MEQCMNGLRRKAKLTHSSKPNKTLSSRCAMCGLDCHQKSRKGIYSSKNPVTASYPYYYTCVNVFSLCGIIHNTLSYYTK
jgi:predicted restriction endonuclease